MKQILRRVLQLGLLCIALFSAWQVAKVFLEYQKGNQIYEQAQILAGKPEESARDAECPVDFMELKKENPEIFGWITIKDTPIQYPLLQGKDNKYYLTHAYNGEYSGFGSIFLDERNNQEMSDQHTILYGHNMKNKAMFGSLSRYRDLEYAKEHEYIQIYLPDRILTYQIFSAYKAHVLDEVYTLEFQDNAAFQLMLEEMLSAGEMAPENIPTTEDRILTLSTCTSAGEVNYRFVVNAVLIEESSMK